LVVKFRVKPVFHCLNLTVDQLPAIFLAFLRINSHLPLELRINKLLLGSDAFPRFPGTDNFGYFLV
jgi:hypothetical protein